MFDSSYFHFLPALMALNNYVSVTHVFLNVRCIK